MLALLLSSPEQLSQGRGLLDPLCGVIAVRRRPKEMSRAFLDIAKLASPSLQKLCLRGLRSRIKGAGSVALSKEARTTLKNWKSSHAEVHREVQALIRSLKVESLVERRTRLAHALKQLSDIHLPSSKRLAAAHELAAEDDPKLTLPMLAALKSSTPPVREVILNSIMSRRNRFAAVLDALEKKVISPADLSILQRTNLQQDRDPNIRRRATALFSKLPGVNEKLFSLYSKSLQGKRDTARGETVFRKTCASCHRVHGIGVAVGPDLSAEFQRAEETFLRDILAPSDTLTSGYRTFSVVTKSGRVFAGVLASESPTSVKLRQADAKEHVILRKDIEVIHASAVSMMPDDLFKTVSPKDAADVIAWLRRPPQRLVLFDDNRAFVTALKDGKGTVELVATDAHSGKACLRVTPPQRHSSRIKGWNFRIREQPGPGEYRYIRFAWKSPGAHGVMLEFAADGRWPPAKKPLRRYHAGKNTTGWSSVKVSNKPPRQWVIVTRDLWRDFGDFTLTGIAPTAMGGPALFDRIEILRSSKVGNPEESRRHRK